LSAGQQLSISIRESDSLYNSDVRAELRPAKMEFPAVALASSTRTDTGVDPQDSPGGVAKLENVAGQTFNRKILVDCADKSFRWFDDDPIIGIVRIAPPEVRATSRAPRRRANDDLRHRDESVPRVAALGAKTIGEHLDDAVEFFARQIR